MENNKKPATKNGKNSVEKTSDIRRKQMESQMESAIDSQKLDTSRNEKKSEKLRLKHK